MDLLEKDLYTATSTIKNAGLGLFTKSFIPKGTLIVEYKGKMKTWKEILAGRGFNAYVYYLTRNHVIDARPVKSGLARFANDANGISKTKGLRNNSSYTVSKKRVYIEAVKNIPAGSEILVDYGHEYWDIIRENKSLGL